MKTFKFSHTLLLFASMILLSTPQAWAVDVEVPEEELAKESVLPRFERGEAVKNRNVITDKKIELGPYFGWNFTEPIYNQAKFGFNAGYHLTEDHTLMLNFVYWLPGRNTQYTDLLYKIQQLEFTRVPNIQFAFWLNWELQAYYGKMSFTKRGVTNLHLYPILGLGMTKTDAKMHPGINVGLGQKFYFGKSFALRIDFKIQYQQGPNPFLASGLKATDPIPAASAFADKFSLGTILDFGFTFLL